MIDRSKRGIRSVGAKARLAVAAAILAGGGAAGVVAIAANHSGSATATTAESAGYTTSFHHTISEALALAKALNGPGTSMPSAMTTLADMTPMRTFSQFEHRQTMLAVQRGIVVLATKKFLVVRSANGAIHLWWLSGATRVKDVASSATGMAAMTGSYTATNTAMLTGDMVPAENVVAGSARLVGQLTAPAAKPARITINTGGQVITVTVAGSAATVTQPMTTTGRVTRTRQSAWSATRGVQRGDLVIVAGTRTHGLLRAGLVLFAAPRSLPRTSATPTANPTVKPSPNATVSGQPVEIGSHS